MAAGLLVGALANPALINALIGLVTKGIERAALSPNISLQPHEAPAVAQQVTQTVLQGIQNNPVLMNELNSERWYQSRVTLGALAGIIVMLLGLIGISISDDERGMMVEAIQALGVLASLGYILYGRWTGNLKPINQSKSST